MDLNSCTNCYACWWKLSSYALLATYGRTCEWTLILAAKDCPTQNSRNASILTLPWNLLTCVPKTRAGVTHRHNLCDLFRDAPVAVLKPNPKPAPKKTLHVSALGRMQWT